MNLILPRTFIEKAGISHPLFFLAGPVLGGGNWQERCCMEISRRLHHFSVVVPCRWKPGDKLSCYRVSGTESRFTRQTAWEYHYLSLATELSKEHQGCIIFWLPAESKEYPRKDGQPYARDTYGELGRWGSIAAVTKSHLVVGAEPDFPGLSVIRENLRLERGLYIDSFPIHSNLEETVNAAVQWVMT
ncbi:MAG: hypothetical protein NT094_00900 [Candidatus Staskawiczbacteria bacterium]|nr:hypothetical protein [Candidatus Staskawiczbacteria bacterium]